MRQRNIHNMEEHERRIAHRAVHSRRSGKRAPGPRIDVTHLLAPLALQAREFGPHHDSVRTAARSTINKLTDFVNADTAKAMVAGLLEELSGQQATA